MGNPATGDLHNFRCWSLVFFMKPERLVAESLRLPGISLRLFLRRQVTDRTLGRKDRASEPRSELLLPRCQAASRAGDGQLRVVVRSS
jgi:hypothetical protein